MVTSQTHQLKSLTSPSRPPVPHGSGNTHLPLCLLATPQPKMGVLNGSYMCLCVCVCCVPVSTQERPDPWAGKAYRRNWRKARNHANCQSYRRTPMMFQRNISYPEGNWNYDFSFVFCACPACFLPPEGGVSCRHRMRKVVPERLSTSSPQ